MHISDSAKNKIIDVLIDVGQPFIRFGVQGGGCNGFQYFFDPTDEKEETDYTISLDDTHEIIVDPMSYQYISDARVDYIKDIMGERFTFENPLHTSMCGCGNSVAF